MVKSELGARDKFLQLTGAARAPGDWQEGGFSEVRHVCLVLNYPSPIKLTPLNIQVHLNKLECRGKVHLFQ